VSSNPKIYLDSHIVDILGCTIGRDQPVMRLEKAYELVSLIPDECFLDDNTVFFNPFCKAGEILLAAALRTCVVKKQRGSPLASFEEILSELRSERYFGLSIDERHYYLAKRTLFGNEASHSEDVTKTIRRGTFLAESNGRLDKNIFQKEFEEMLNFIKSNRDGKKVIAVGNPPYQESDGGGTGKSAIPVYNLFVDQLILAPIEQFLVVIPSRWFAGGKGLDKFREKILGSRHLKSITNFSNSSEVFPTVDINGGVCFLQYDKEADYNVFDYISNGETHVIDASNLDILPDDPLGIEVVRGLRAKWSGGWVGDVAYPRNAFGVPSNLYKTRKLDAHQSKGAIKCYFERRQVYYVPKASITKNENLIQNYKVVVSKAAGGSKGNRRSTIPTNVMFLIEPGSICSETYSVVKDFNSKAEACRFLEYIKSDWVRYLVGLRKNTQNIKRDTWSWVPDFDLDKYASEEDLYKHFSIPLEQRAHIKRKVKEWS